MGLISPRKLYVTWEEFDELSKLGLRQMNGVLSESEFVKAVGELLDLWATRGTIKDKMDRNNKEKMEAARQRAIKSLTVEDL